MSRPEWTHIKPHNPVPPVPEIKGKAKHGNKRANPIISGTAGDQLQQRQRKKNHDEG